MSDGDRLTNHTYGVIVTAVVFPCSWFGCRHWTKTGVRHSLLMLRAPSAGDKRGVFRKGHWTGSRER